LGGENECGVFEENLKNDTLGFVAVMDLSAIST
jgi:hypothetical protein